MWADAETYRDFLNYSEVAELTVALIKDQNMRPLSVGVFGTWGTGKSTLLNLIERQLRPEVDRESDYIVVRFDAWLYQGYDDARAALMEVIASELISAAEAKKDAAPLVAKAESFLNRVNYFRVAGLLAEGGAAALGFPAFGAISKGVGALSHLFAGDGTDADAEKLKAAVEDAQKQGKDLLNAVSKRTPPKEINAFRSDLGGLLKDLGKTLVVFIDNLDRCLPKQTIQTLEALRLFLFMSNTAFVIAADEDMVRHAVVEHFTNLDNNHVRDYLDKLIQVPVRVPRLGLLEVRAYMFLLFASAAGVSDDVHERLRLGLEADLRRSWKDEPISRQNALKLIGGTPSEELIRNFEIADRVAPLLASSAVVNGNPRIVKRMLNVIRMRTNLARAREIPLDEAVIAKLALFERCTGVNAIAALYTEIQESAGGKAALFKTLEGLQEAPDKLAAACPESWKAFLPFVTEWVALEPMLADRDLRPALYLSRETLPLRIARGNLSPAAETALQVLLVATTTSAPSAVKAVGQVPAAEHIAVMDAIVEALRKHDDWTTRPPGFNGALILANTSAAAGAVLATHLKSLGGKPPPWLEAVLKNAAWFKALGKT